MHLVPWLSSNAAQHKSVRPLAIKAAFARFRVQSIRLKAQDCDLRFGLPADQLTFVQLDNPFLTDFD
jgi:hypothetical protein